jgi:hypothetical protein
VRTRFLPLIALLPVLAGSQCSDVVDLVERVFEDSPPAVYPTLDRVDADLAHGQTGQLPEIFRAVAWDVDSAAAMDLATTARRAPLRSRATGPTTTPTACVTRATPTTTTTVIPT